MSSGGGGDKSPRKPARPVKSKGAGGGGGGGSKPDPCNIVERTKVNSPVRAVAVTVRVHDVLDIVYDPGPPKRLLVRTSSGAILGSITSPSMAQIIQCILSGYEYEATVLAISGGAIEVEVQPK